jgi:hypothetical protein
MLLTKRLDHPLRVIESLVAIRLIQQRGLLFVKGGIRPHQAAFEVSPSLPYAY